MSWKGLSLQKGLAALRIEGERSVTDRIRIDLSRRGSRGAAQESPDPGDQLQGKEGLAQIIVAAQGETRDTVQRTVLHGDEDDGKLRQLFAQEGANAQSVRAGHKDVQDHQIRRTFQDSGQKLAPIREGGDPKTLLGQKLRHKGTDLSLIVSKINTLRHSKYLKSKA